MNDQEPVNSQCAESPLPGLQILSSQCPSLVCRWQMLFRYRKSACKLLLTDWEMTYTYHSSLDKT